MGFISVAGFSILLVLCGINVVDNPVEAIALISYFVILGGKG